VRTNALTCMRGDSFAGIDGRSSSSPATRRAMGDVYPYSPSAHQTNEAQECYIRVAVMWA
jgi:hypothetical protein